MSKFYGTVSGAAQTEATRRGFDGIRVSAQSWDGSHITRMNYDHDGRLIVDLAVSEGSSSCWGSTIFRGTLDELKGKLSGTDEPAPTAEELEDRLMDATDLLSCSLAKYEAGTIDGAGLFARMLTLSKLLADEANE